MSAPLLAADTVADLLRVGGVMLGGVSFGAALVVYRRLPLVWKKEDLVAARFFVVAHFLVVLFIVGALAEKAGEPMTWRTPVALMIFTLKIAMLALLRERIDGINLRTNPPARRALDA